MSNTKLEAMADALDLTDEERGVFEVAETVAPTGKATAARILAQYHLARRLELAAQVLDGASVALQKSMQASAGKLKDSLETTAKDLIASNRALAQASGRYARALNILTGALVLVGVLQLFFH